MKKVLIISYYWPPSGGSGVQRWLKFSKFLPKYGIKPYVYTPKNPTIELIDNELTKQISNDVTVWKKKIYEPYSIKNMFSKKSKKTETSGVISNSKFGFIFNWIRGNFFIPDPKVLWIKPSINYLEKKLTENSIDTIISTGPPHSMHLIALALKNKLNLKWIADFRDPWSELDMLNEFHLTKSSINRHKSLENQVLKKCNICLTVSEKWVKMFSELGARNVKLITNGFDEDDFKVSTEVSVDKFVIGHFGLINHLRNPTMLWKALNQICEENNDFDSKLEIRLSGNIDLNILSKIENFKYLKGKIKNLGYLSHSEVIKQYNKSNVLLLLLFNSESGKGNYPGKVFEYFATQKPILSFGPSESDTKELFSEFNKAFYHSYDDSIDIIKKTIEILFSKNYKSDNYDLKRFTRENLTKELADLIISID